MRRTHGTRPVGLGNASHDRAKQRIATVSEQMGEFKQSPFSEIRAG